MSVRTWRLFTVGFIASAIGAFTSAVPAAAASKISYSGQSFAVKTVVSSSTTVLADTGALSGTGGALEASSLSGTVPDTLTVDTLHATTIGQGDRVRSEASGEIIAVTAGANSISANLFMSRAMAVSHASTASVSGRSHVSNLVVNGVPVVVTGQANQIVPVVNGQLVINEQISSVSGDTGSITVNALHLTVSGGADVVLGSSRAGVVAGSQNCAQNKDFATGGGWLVPEAGEKRTFGVIGGIQQNVTFRGHLVFINHETNDRVRGEITNYTPGTGNFREMNGEGQFNGEFQQFFLRLEDLTDDGTADRFELRYTFPPRPRPVESGLLAGGNIQIHTPCQ